MSNLVLVVDVSVDPQHLEALKPAMLHNAANSVKEDGCLQFDVIQSQEDPNAFIFYEVYKNADALASHRETPHFKAYWKVLEEVGDEIRRCPRLFDKIS